ncbi:MAG TPA: T9SS type A sorting domain-containing protein [Edaphocola sp.]|nr:T9SS type A sorting domain-containing protein [Edaphocola sp.]
MKHTITGIKQALLMAALAALLPLWAVAQQVTVNRVYDFSGNDTMNSEIKFVYADSNRIIALGEAYPEGEKPHAFTAAFDYSGNLLWQKPILLPGALITNAWGYNNLIKTPTGLYVAAGNVPNALKADSSRACRPFLYLFDAQGDSVRLLLLPNDSTISDRLSAITVNPAGQIVIGGDAWYCIGYSSDTDVISYAGDSVSKRNLWFEKYDGSLNMITHSDIRVTDIYPGLPYMYYPNPYIVNIMADSQHYVINGSCNYTMKGQLVLGLDTNLAMTTWNNQVGQPTLTHLSSPPLLAQGMPFESNIVRMKGQQQSYYWSLPAIITDHSTPIGQGIYYARAKLNIDSTASFYHVNWDRAIIDDTAHLPSETGFPGVVQGRSDLELALNGDMLLQKEAGRPSDTETATPHSGYFLPAMLRVDTNGNTRWGKVFQHVHSVDSGLYHSFNDVSVSPDGRIVMGGYLRSRYPVGAYDTVGTVSWLVVLDDSVHDHSQDTTTAIAVPMAGNHVRVSVYPNPTLDNTTIDVQDFKGRPRDFEWQLSDITGRLLQSRSMAANQEMIRLERYAPGLYLLRLNYKGKPAATVKVLKE